MQRSGYSGPPLAIKLGYKEGFRVRIIHPPENFFDQLEGLPEKTDFRTDQKTKKDLIHFFTRHLIDLEQQIPALKREIVPAGIIWVSWPKKSAKLETDITEDIIRKVALNHGLVDVKVCAVDQVWSGLKLVIPVKDRQTQ